SSRRRHTSSKRDWSSDVCSSDLKQLSPIDVSNALNLQNLILPAGTAKFAANEYPIRLNSSPAAIDEFNTLPIKTVNGATIYMKEIGRASCRERVQTARGSRVRGG